MELSDAYARTNQVGPHCEMAQLNLPCLGYRQDCPSTRQDCPSTDFAGQHNAARHPSSRFDWISNLPCAFRSRWEERMHVMVEREVIIYSMWFARNA